MIVMPPLHLAVLVANGLFAFWLSRQSWNWIRKYTSFLLIETIFFFITIEMPRPTYEQNPVFRHLLPHGTYFFFLWSAVEVIFFLKLLDFVMCRAADRDPREYSLERFLFFLFYPYAFLAGPVIGFEEFYRSYHAGPTRLPDLLYAARKCAWGGLQLFVASPWLSVALLNLRGVVVRGEPLATVEDPRLLMWIWLGGMSVLLYIIYKGYTDLMLGLSRLVGFHFHEQFHFTLFAKNPVEYWQNGNRGVYRITSQHVFNRFFDRRRVPLKAVMATVSSGLVHSLMCPAVALSGAVLLGSLFGASGVAVAAFQRLSVTRVAGLFEWGAEGTGHNALVLAGVTLTFFMMAFPRATFLLLVEGRSVPEWVRLVRLLFVRA
jgi:D-alanyl-lipoteichoic acid acyltransferase DltB (MBOAT superfamily)